jgi:hypothetical protein
MKQLHVIVFVCVVALGTVSPRAQQQDHVLRFEVAKNGTAVAAPELRLRSGMLGRINLDSRDAPTAPLASGLREKIALTPTVQGENISIAFDITSDTRQFRPTLVISKDIKGGLEWVSTDGHTIRLTVSWVQ